MKKQKLHIYKFVFICRRIVCIFVLLLVLIVFSSDLRRASIRKLPQSWSRCGPPDKPASSLQPVARDQLHHLVVNHVTTFRRLKTLELDFLAISRSGARAETPLEAPFVDFRAIQRASFFLGQRDLPLNSAHGEKREYNHRSMPSKKKKKNLSVMIPTLQR